MFWADFNKCHYVTSVNSAQVLCFGVRERFQPCSHISGALSQSDLASIMGSVQNSTSKERLPGWLLQEGLLGIQLVLLFRLSHCPQQSDRERCCITDEIQNQNPGLLSSFISPLVLLIRTKELS